MQAFAIELGNNVRDCMTTDKALTSEGTEVKSAANENGIQPSGINRNNDSQKVCDAPGSYCLTSPDHP